MPVRRLLGLATVALLTSALASGCGGTTGAKAGAKAGATSTPTASAAPTTSAAPLPTGKIKLLKPSARATILPSATATSLAGVRQIYSAANADTIEGFPVPQGAKVTDPGAIEQTWQFDIATRKPAEVLAFYKSVLPQLGFRVRLDVTYTQGYENVHWDLVFDGRYSGSMAIDRVDHTVFVVVNPPGQPAFAGDTQK